MSIKPWLMKSWLWSRRVVYSHGHDIQLLRGGQELFAQMLVAIEQAQQHVYLGTYIFHHDEATQDIVAALCQAAARGVDVRVVVDGFGSRFSLSVLRTYFEQSGVRFTVFRPLRSNWEMLLPGRLRRLHQKLCVVDGRTGFVGGINLLHDQLDLVHGWSLYPRLDFAVRVTGPMVSSILLTLETVWQRAERGEGWREEFMDLTRIFRKTAFTPEQTTQNMKAAFVIRDNFRQRRTIERSYIAAIESARKQVLLATPYFYPGRRFRRALQTAAQRGVRVQLLLQGKVDYPIAKWAAQVLYEEMMRSGIDIYEYTPAFLHAKVAVVDERWATVGSSNIDPSSFLVNLEANVMVKDAAFARELKQEVEQALAQSQRIGPQSLPPPSRWMRRLIAALAHLYLYINGRRKRS